jgi:cellulose synthase/poly-beta-1,6-N-acetylglucosamine synthase-like glycosyltransferase
MNLLNSLAVLVALHILFTWAVAVLTGLRARQNTPGRRYPSRDSWPLASVMIPAWNEKGTLPDCINSLRLVDYPHWEVIVIAGGPDGTYETAKNLDDEGGRIKVVEQQPLGKNAALNKGLQTAHGELIVILDADCTVSSDWLKELIAPLNEKVVATTGNCSPFRETPISLGEQMERISAYKVNKSNLLNGSGSIAVARKEIEQLGGFPEEVKVGVDWDLNARIAERGLARVFCPNARIRTHRPATLEEYWKNELRWRRAHFRSLIRLKNYFMSDLRTTVRSFYFYALSWFSVLFSLFVVILVTTVSPIASLALSIWGLFICWLLFRRASLAVEVSVFERDWEWLRLIWVPPLLLCLALASGWVATLSLSREKTHFKGPR